MTGGELNVTSDINIQGSGQTIDAAGASGIFSTYAATFGLSSVILTGGSGDSQNYVRLGGAIYALSSMLTVSNTTITGNTANAGGGIMLNESSLTLSNSTVSGNLAEENSNSDGGHGGGIAVKYDSNLVLTDSTVSGNTAADNGGGIYQGPGLASYYGYGGSLTLVTSAVSNNIAGRDGGGIAAVYASVNIGNSTITNNQASAQSATYADHAGGGISAFHSQVALNGSTISTNTTTGPTASEQLVGGLFAFSSTVTMSNCTVANNTASGGIFIAGGIFETHESTETGYGLTLINTTVSGNSATASGGDAYHPGVGGVLGIQYNDSDGDLRSLLTLNNTIVSGNHGNTDNDVSISGFSSGLTANFSLLGTLAANDAFQFISGSNNIFDDSSGLCTLTNNGGPTLTMLPITGSPAIDVGSNTLAIDTSSAPLQLDQRGSGYARITGGTVDIGAVEFGSVVAGPVGPGGPAGPSIPVPTLSTWAAALLASLLGLGTLLTGRRRRRHESRLG